LEDDARLEPLPDRIHESVHLEATTQKSRTTSLNTFEIRRTFPRASLTVMVIASRAPTMTDFRSPMAAYLFDLQAAIEAQLREADQQAKLRQFDLSPRALIETELPYTAVHIAAEAVFAEN
jgi:hypothetical protein